MPVQRCPQCQLPLTEEETATGVCPVCAASLAGEPTAAVAPAPPATPTPARFGGGLVVALVAAVLAVVAVGVYVFYPPQPPEEPGQVNHDRKGDEFMAKAKLPKKKPAATDPKPPEVVADKIQPERIPAPRGVLNDTPVAEAKLIPEKIPAPKVMVEVKPKKEKDKEKQPPVAVNGEVLVGKERQLNRPDGDYVLPEHHGGGKFLKVSGPVQTLTVNAVFNHAVLNLVNLQGRDLVIKRIEDHARITASGKVKTLTVHSIRNGGVLDASQLEAEEIVFTGRMEDHTRVKLNSKVKVLRVMEMLNGATLEVLQVDATEITFAKRLDGHGKVTLSGKVKTLSVGEVNTGVQLDASKLEAQTIIVASRLDNHARLKLNAPNGVVEFRNEVLGNAHVDITAPGGKVTFVGAPQGKPKFRIDNGSRVFITAKEVEFLGLLTGNGTHVVVTLTDGGSLRFREMDGSARLQYRKANPGAAEPTLESGVVKGRAKVEKIR